jgi:hypothetical protein
MMKSKILFVAGLLLTTATVHADDVTIYRCTDARGVLILQNKPCEQGMKQEVKIMHDDLSTAPAPASQSMSPTPPVAPTPTPMTDASSSTAKPDEDLILDSANPPPPTPPSTNAPDRLPPPILFECTTYDRDHYISEDATPPPRCVPLQTVGLDGNPATGAGQACEMKHDQCARVPDGALCDAWKKRLGETEVAWRFGKAENTEKNKAEYERVQRIVSESTCTQ